MTPTRDEAIALMEEWTDSPSLRKHMLAVEAAVVAYARRHGADEELWAVASVLHDFDYERHPLLGDARAGGDQSAGSDQPVGGGERAVGEEEAGHPYVGVRELERRGYPKEVTEAILGHADFTGVPRESLLAKVLYACDELTGLITAAVLVRPDKDIAGLTLASLKKKFKDKAFARGVNRDDVRRGAEELGVDLWEHAQFVLEAMQARAGELGLAGSSG